MGRPLMYKTVEELESKIQEYFDTQCKVETLLDSNGMPIMNSKGQPVQKIDPPTVAGLAYYLGFISRSSIYEYKERDEYTDTIKRAILKIEEFAEKGLYSSGCTGAIFWLKNHGWKDKTEQETKNVQILVASEDVKDMISEA